MERGPTSVEDNAATRSTGSNIVQINSIYIDLKFPPENNEIRCRDHNFSIRGYAAEMRKKNPRASMPFPNASLNNIEEQLPPMHVPKFRWWCCLECRKKMEDASNVEGTPVHSTCCTHNTPSNVPSHADAIVTPSETQPPPLVQLSESMRNVDINAPPSHQEPNYAETKYVSASGGDAGPVGLIIVEAGPTRDEETNAETGNVITAGDSNGITEQEDNDGSTRGIHSEFQQPGLGSSTNAKQIRFRLIPSQTDAIHNAVDVAAAEIVNSSGVAPILVEESGNASTGSEQNKRHENASGVSRRRRKVRSLTELLGDKGKLRSDVLKADVPSIHPKVVPASGSVTVLSQDQTPHEDIGNKSPQRKRKTPQEEPEGNIDPRIAGPGGSISKAVSGRKVTDNATCSSEAQANASSAVRLQIANINVHFNRKAEKAPVLVKRKDKQIQVHDRFSPRPGEQSSSKNRTKGGNFHIASDNTLSRSLGTSSAAGEIDNHSRNFQSPQVPDREKGQCTSLISKSQPSHLKVGLDLSLNSFARKIVSSGNKEKSSSSKSIRERNDLHFGQCSSLRAPEPDRLPKKSRDWDLNESIARNSNNLVEKRYPSLTKKTRCQKEKISEVEERPQEINRQSDNMGSYRMSQGSPDDIPMEIVELMAKNQYERGLPDAGTNSFQHRIPNSMGRFSDVQGTGTIIFTKEFPALTSFSSANARSGLAMTGNAINYPQMNRNNFEIFNPEKSKMSIFDMFPLNQQIFSRGMQGPASASVSTGSQRSERAEIIASSAAPNMSFGLGIQQNYSAQSPQLQHRGKTISDIKADEMKKRQEAHIILSRLGNSQLRIEPKGPVDPYANDNIPAMQLLSLMNGTSPGTTFNIGSSKPFTPCGYHPRYSTTERRDMLSGPLFQRQSRLGTGTFSVGESSGRSPGQRPFAFPGPREENQSYLARYTSGIPYTGPTSTRGKPKETENVGASDSIPYLQQHLGRRSVSLENGSITEEVQQLRLIPREEQNCVTNQNPAEFILPDSEAFTICWKDLKIPKRKYPRGDPGDGMKRPRVVKPKQGRSNH